MNPNYTYPTSPAGVSPDLLRPSTAFQRAAWFTIAGIIFFILVYLTLIASAAALVYAATMAGLMMLSAVQHWIILLAVIGLVIASLMVFFFLIKFLFKRNKVDYSGLIEITPEQQPELVDFIHRVADECGTTYPKRIFLSSEVNASVSYNSSFLALFLPVRKNLTIGLGLVNTLNLTEFKAVLAHEFGHFSQRSMRLGNFVYQVNRIIFNLLYENNDYSSLIQKWSSVSNVFGLFAILTVKVVEGCQWLLVKVYSVVNLRYLSLSRQMEFHADAVAASVTGSAPLAEALYRIDLANTCYQHVLSDLNRQVVLHRKAVNIYPMQMHVLHHIAREEDLPLVAGLPQVTGAKLLHANHNRIVISDQWASHPSNQDREAHLKQLQLPATDVTESAWVLFADKAALQERITTDLYATVKFEQEPQPLPPLAYERWFNDDIGKFKIDRFYNGYYENYTPATINTTIVASQTNTRDAVQALFNASWVALTRKKAGLFNDLQLASLLEKKEINLRTFDFDGNKYKRRDAGMIRARLAEEERELNSQLQQHDQLIYSSFLALAAQKGQEQQLRDAYTEWMLLTETAKTIGETLPKLQAALQPLFGGELPIEFIQNQLTEVYAQEKPYREGVQRILAEPKLLRALESAHHQKLMLYATNNGGYFDGSAFNQHNLDLLLESLPLMDTVCTRSVAQLKAELLELQLQWIPA